MLASAKLAPVHAARMRQNGPQCIFIACPCHTMHAHNFAFKPPFFTVPVSGAFVPGQCHAAAINPGASIPGHAWPLRARQSMPGQFQARKRKNPESIRAYVIGNIPAFALAALQRTRHGKALPLLTCRHCPVLSQSHGQAIVANAAQGQHPGLLWPWRICTRHRYRRVQCSAC